MNIGSNTRYVFLYDATGPMALRVYNGTAVTTYYYVRNLQGDIIAILNTAGKAVVEYTYDAWGNVLTVTGEAKDTIGQQNPLLYRGYVYDRETKLYYLQSRYYDPAMGRFLICQFIGNKNYDSTEVCARKGWSAYRCYLSLLEVILWITAVAQGLFLEICRSRSN